MATRSARGNVKALREQYGLLKYAVDDFFAGHDARALDIATRIRVLVHDTKNSHALLAAVNPNYLELDIFRRLPPSPKTIFAVSATIQMNSEGTARILRDDFTSAIHELVPLERWWKDDCLVIWGDRYPRRQVILDVADKCGGAHVDPEVPARYEKASEPPFQFGLNGTFIRPDLARITVAQAGDELRDYLERHFTNDLH